MTPIVDQYRRLALQLYQLRSRGLNLSDEADEVVEQLQHVWLQLTEEERKVERSLSVERQKLYGYDAREFLNETQK